MNFVFMILSLAVINPSFADTGPMSNTSASYDVCERFVLSYAQEHSELKSLKADVNDRLYEDEGGVTLEMLAGIDRMEMDLASHLQDIRRVCARE